MKSCLKRRGIEMADHPNLALHILGHLGAMTTMLAQAVSFILRRRVNLHDTFDQMRRIGVESLPMVSITGFATGMVLVVQIGDQFVKMGAETYVGGVVALALARELSPILTSIVVAGRIGSAMAAEIGTMRVTEQIDALETLAVPPVRYLVVPRLIAGVLMLPLLTVFSNMVGMIGGLIVATMQFHMSVVSFQESIKAQLLVSDVMGGLLKSTIFGLIIATVGCYRGFITRGGAEGVGESTTGSVVTAIVIILVSNYFLAVLMLNFAAAFLR